MRRARADGEHGAVAAVEVDERADKAACAVGEGDGLPEVDVRVDGDATEDVELDDANLSSPPIASRRAMARRAAPRNRSAPAHGHSSSQWGYSASISSASTSTRGSSGAGTVRESMEMLLSPLRKSLEAVRS